MRVKVRLVSEEKTGTIYYTTVPKQQENKLRVRKFDRKLGRHAWFKQEKMK